MINPIDLLAEDCAFWESRYDYINLLTEFINSKITGQDFETRFYEMFRKDVDKKYNWEQISLRIPEDNEQIIKQNTLNEILSELFTDCDVFEGNPDLWQDGDVSEDELREYARQKLADIKALMKN